MTDQSQDWIKREQELIAEVEFHKQKMVEELDKLNGEFDDQRQQLESQYEEYYAKKIDEIEKDNNERVFNLESDKQ